MATGTIFGVAAKSPDIVAVDQNGTRSAGQKYRRRSAIAAAVDDVAAMGLYRRTDPAGHADGNSQRSIQRGVRVAAIAVACTASSVCNDRRILHRDGTRGAPEQNRRCAAVTAKNAALAAVSHGLAAAQGDVPRRDQRNVGVTAIAEK